MKLSSQKESILLPCIFGTTFFCLIWILIEAEKKSEEPVLKINCPPGKPDFTWLVTNITTIRIIWLPSHDEGKCDGEEAGTNFSVRYKAIDSNQWFKSRLDGIQNETYDLEYLFPGKIYEVLVTSERNNFKTDSDLQEIVLPPWTSPVQSVKAISLANTSILISWKPPGQLLGKIDGYLITYNTFNKNLNTAHFDYIHFPIVCSGDDCRSAAEVWRLGGNIIDYSNMIMKDAENLENYEQIKVPDLKTGTKYTFHITPYVEDKTRVEFEQFGFVYTFEHMLSPQLSNVHLPLAKPSFRISGRRDGECSLKIQWLPCGLKFDCKNSRPGSAFKVEITKANGSMIYEATEERNDYHRIEVGFIMYEATKEENYDHNTEIEDILTINVTVTSIDGQINSDTASEIIECDKKLNK